MTEPQTVGGRYALGARLGAGGMGRVYRARHLELGKAFALKLVAPAQGADARARFVEEARLASAISHPNIVSVVDFGDDPQHGAYMVMELVDGVPIARGAPLSLRRACELLGQVADALHHAHERGIVHGDVKAENILVSRESVGARRRHAVRLLDFGLARRAAAASRENLAIGSPHYLAPERAAGGPATIAGDIYALGVLAFELLTGALPFDGEPVEILLAHAHAPLPPLGDAIDPALDQLVRRATAKRPADRHASAAAFRYELNTVQDMLGLGRRRRALGTPLPMPRIREAALAAAFEHSPLPQALLSLDGSIRFANAAFDALVADAFGGAAVLDAVVPDLPRALAAVHASGAPAEQRIRLDGAAELALWFAPLPLAGSEIHLTIVTAPLR